MLNMSNFDEAYAQHPRLKKEAEISCKPQHALWVRMPQSPRLVRKVLFS